MPWVLQCLAVISIRVIQDLSPDAGNPGHEWGVRGDGAHKELALRGPARIITSLHIQLPRVKEQQVVGKKRVAEIRGDSALQCPDGIHC